MEREIAILTDLNGNITSAARASGIIKYVKGDEDWEKNGEIRIEPLETDALESEEDQEEQLSRVRDYCSGIIDSLENCRIIAGTQISGIVYKMLSSRDYVIAETNDFSEDMLDEIYEKALMADAPSREVVLSWEPEEKNPGEYFFNFRALKSKYKAATSKETIRPFLAKNDFEKLTIICSHKMPWLDEDLERYGLICEESREGADLILVITPRR